MTSPLVPPNCSLVGFNRMMIDIPRLRKSKHDALVDDGAWRAGFNLWFSAWQSVPAGSLEEDDDVLRVAAGLGRDQASWVRIRPDVLRSWVKCTDGRLYHPTVCELALEAWLERLSARKMAAAGNRKQWGKGDAQEAILAEIFTALDALEALNPGSDALKKYRKRYGRPDVRPAPTPKPPGPESAAARTKSDKKSPGGLPSGPRTGSQAEAEGRSSVSGINTEINSSPPESSIRAMPLELQPQQPQPFSVWKDRIAKLLVDLPKVDPTSAGILNLAPLIALEAEGLDYDRHIAPAIVAIAATWKGRGLIRSWGIKTFAEMAHANWEAENRKGTENGKSRPSVRNGSAPRGAAAVRDRIARAEQLREPALDSVPDPFDTSPAGQAALAAYLEDDGDFPEGDAAGE